MSDTLTGDDKATIATIVDEAARSAEALLDGAPFDWPGVARIYAYALEAIGVLVGAAPPTGQPTQPPPEPKE